MNRSIEQKLQEVFGSSVVHKGTVREAGLPRLPQYVVEYLVANHVRTESAKADLGTMREHVARNFPEAEAREVVKARLVREGEVVVIDKAAVEVNLRTGKLVCALTFLGESNVDILEGIVNKHPRLLTGGMWGAYRIKYKYGQKRNSLVVRGVMPFQVDTPDLGEYAHMRGKFTTEEWIDILLASVGYEPEQYNGRQKMLLLLRLVPALEANVNMLELGPRQTGKTFLLRNMSPSVYTASGANVSAASLFANISTGKMGILANYKIVQLDEIAHTNFDNVSTVSMLKDFMESGQFARGGQTYSSEASLVLAGNIDVNGNDPADSYEHLFAPLPRELQDTAFLDRVHAYVPGWEIPKISSSSISHGRGLVVDYLEQVFAKLRSRDRRGVLQNLEMPAGLTRRDVVAIEKVASGLFKLLFPHDVLEGVELQQLVNFVAEMRQRVNNELARMAPGEFQPKHFYFKNAARLHAVP